MSRANSCDTIADHLFELFLDILTDNKYYFIKSGFDSVMNGIIHDDLTIWANRC